MADVATRRTRAERAAAGAAPVAVVTLPTGSAGVGGRPPRALIRRAVTGDGPDGITLGFDFGGTRAADVLVDRLPPPLVRQAAAMLAVVARAAVDEREVSDLRRTDVERKRFVSTVAHELRAPITGLGGYLDLLLERPDADPGDREEFLERSRRIVDTMAELVDGPPGGRADRIGRARSRDRQGLDRRCAGRRQGPAGADGRGEARRARRPARVEAPHRGGGPRARRTDRREPRGKRRQVHASGGFGGGRGRLRRAGEPRGRPGLGARDPADGGRAHLRAVRPAGRPSVRAGHGTRPADRERPRADDGWRHRGGLDRGPRVDVRPRAPGADGHPLRESSASASSVPSSRRASGSASPASRAMPRSTGSPNMGPVFHRRAASEVKLSTTGSARREVVDNHVDVPAAWVYRPPSARTGWPAAEGATHEGLGETRP